MKSQTEAVQWPDSILRVLRHTGLRARDAGLEKIENWISQRIRHHGMGSIDEYTDLLGQTNRKAGHERELFTVRFTTGETYFFRDKGQFQLLAKQILPELIERRRASSEHCLRIWSAGCSSGEEAYSLAMLVDGFSDQLIGWDVQIQGTDIDSTAIDRARRGIYGEWSFRGFDELLRKRYFRAHQEGWEIEQRLKDMVSWQRIDLLQDSFRQASTRLHNVDLILCRNVFIYLEDEAVKTITAKFADTLADGGYLLTQHSELYGHVHSRLRSRLFTDSVVFQKQGDESYSPPATATAPSQPLPGHLPDQVFRKKIIRESIQHAEQVTKVTVDNDDIEAMMDLAWSKANSGENDAAERACLGFIALAPLDPRPYYLQALLASQRGEKSSNKELLRKVIYLDPSFIAAYLDLAAAYDSAGDKARAQRTREIACEQMRKLNGDSTVAYYPDSTIRDILSSLEQQIAAGAEQGSTGK